MSYALGLQLGARLGGVQIDGAAFAAGVEDAGSGAKPQLSQQEIVEALNNLQKQVMAKADAAADTNQKAGDTYLAENAKKEGVKTTASGLQYKVLKSGTGKTPKAADTVSVNYRGTLINGKEFDASHGTPVSFPVNGVIPGWTEALQLMKEGDKWQLIIPAKLAYGANSPSPDIGPNEVLVFEVELLEVKPSGGK
jgi:FKBP-type peptidyl-prolyl cis-trans isomerase FklB